MSERLTLEEFSERYMDENSDQCQCHVTDFPPCMFCEGYALKDAYEEYLENFEEEKSNE